MNQTRILKLNENEHDGGAVIYVMSRDQRVKDNHALLTAQQTAVQHNVPLYVVFNLKEVKNRAWEHYDFMLKGLREVADELANFSIPFILTSGDAVENILKTAQDLKAGSLYFDFSPLKSSRDRAKKVAVGFKGAVLVVDTHNSIPVWVASDKREFAAHTMRRKVHLSLEKYVVEPSMIVKHTVTTPHTIKSMSFEEAQEYISQIPRRGITIAAIPGEKAATKHLNDFIDNGLERYAVGRNNIVDDQQSGFSPYLHFGQISSLRIALEVIKHSDRRPLLFEEVKLASPGDTPSIYDGVNALLEEMIVRKELADNFCFYEKKYLSITSGPEWAQKSLAAHGSDIREHIYTREQWEQARTHDISWNAAQNQLRKTGKMHGYMRMYWAKKMLEWSETPEVALADCIYLNDAYSVDGGDPSGYVGILWSMVGLHDRPWFDRPVFGAVRYMNEAGLMRKYDVASYQRKWND
ncbi:deoxyribodipyrimidine photo-lyase [Candidatus Saccharibacteria bacterium]|nr:deoxyribodipyrimidine photo-lyase [Candidatus Saccharibacteria bacterium]